MYETTVKEREVINLRVQKVTWGGGLDGGGQEWQAGEKREVI